MKWKKLKGRTMATAKKPGIAKKKTAAATRKKPEKDAQEAAEQAAHVDDSAKGAGHGEHVDGSVG